MAKTLFGRRTIPSAIDELAQRCPEKTWVAFPNDDQKLCNVSFARCSLAINAASWWLKETIGTSEGFDTVAYLGPNDVRYLILFCAASKCGYKILFTSPRNSRDGHAKLLSETNCKAVLYDPAFGLQTLAAITGLNTVAVPSLEDLLGTQDDRPFHFEKSFDEARDDPCVVLHTSGTTSLPKPIVLTHGNLAVFDAQWRVHPLRDASGERKVFVDAMASSSPFLVTLPFFHMAGFSMGTWLPLNVDMSVVFVNPSRPLSLHLIEQTLDTMHIGGAIMPPSILEQVAESATALEKIARLRHVFYGGASLSPAAGHAISSRTHLCNQIGSTESVVLTTHLTDKSDWDYFCFGSEWSGYEFRECGLPGMFEMVIVRDPSKQDFQSLFQGNNMQEFRTRDIYSRHPEKPNHWKHRGRLDDVIVLANGEKLNPVSNEQLLGAHPLLSSCMYVGTGRTQPAVILELAEPDDSKLDIDQVITKVWPTIEKINVLTPSHGQLQRSHILVAPSSKRFCRTTKGGLKRLETVNLFQEEINRLYESSFEAVGSISGVDITQHDELQDAVRLVYQKVTRTTSLQLDDDIFRAGADSLSIQAAVSTFKASLFSPGVSIDKHWINQKAIYANPTVRSMTEFLERLGRPRGSPGDPLFEQQGKFLAFYEKYRKQLPSAAPPANIVSDEIAPPPTTVLLTGSTGNLGTYLLDTLLGRDDVHEVICLNRSADAAERQVKTHGEKGLRVVFSKHNLKFLHADLSEPKLGLTASEYDYISSRVTCILHNQWPVNFNLSLASFGPQLQGVVNLVRFATDAAHRPKVLFVSSISTVNNWSHQVQLKGPVYYSVPERHLVDLSLASRGYGQSKAVASDLLFSASSQCGLQGATVRLGQLAGPARPRQGLWNRTEWLPILVKTSLAMGALPRTIPLLNEIDWIPIDSAAQIVVELALDVPVGSQAGLEQCDLSLFNVANPHTVPWETLIPAVQSYCNNGLDVIPYGEWLRLLEAKATAQHDAQLVAELPALKLLSFFQDLLEGQMNGAQQTLLKTDGTRKASRHLDQVGAVDATMMLKWMKQWNL